VLQLINEFLPVRELAGPPHWSGRCCGNFGLVESEAVDHFLATALGKKREPANGSLNGPEGSMFGARPRSHPVATGQEITSGSRTPRVNQRGRSRKLPPAFRGKSISDKTFPPVSNASR